MTFKEHIDKWIPNEDLSKIEIYSCMCANITDLNGVEDMVNLKRLYIHNNLIYDLSPIKNLIKLEILWCFNNYIKSLEPIGNLINIVDLRCYNNELKNLYGIENMNLNHFNLESFKLNPCTNDYILSFVDIKIKIISEKRKEKINFLLKNTIIHNDT